MVQKKKKAKGAKFLTYWLAPNTEDWNSFIDRIKFST